jgi:hypothetical protein
MEAAAADVRKYLGAFSTFTCGFSLPIVSFGSVDVDAAAYLRHARNATACSNKSCITAFKKQVSLELFTKGQATDLPADESAYAVGMIECSNGYVGIMIQCPSPRSEYADQIHPVVVVIDGKNDGIEEATADTRSITKKEAEESIRAGLNRQTETGVGV